MPTITSLGVGSGLDLQGLLTGLMDAERSQLEAPLNRREDELQAQLTAYGSLKGALSSFQTALSGLHQATTFQKSTTSVSDSSVFTATATGSLSSADYGIEVTDIATSHKLASGQFASNTDAVGTGELTFRFGTYDAGSNTFTANPDKTIETVTIDASNNSLQGIRDAVNQADIGVTASIVNDGSGYRLLFKSDATGEENSLEITVNDTGDGNNTDTAGLSQLAYDPTAAGVGSGRNMVQTVAATDAHFSIDGLAMTRSSNTVSGAIEGVTLELKGSNAGSTATLSVAQDKDSIKQAVNSFVSGYNTLVGSLDALAGYDAEEEKGGVLLGDSVTRTLTDQMQKILSGAVQGLSGQYNSLSQLGLSTQLDGTLELDDAVFNQALDNDVNAVSRVFAATGATSDALVGFVGATDDTQVGTYAIDITRLATQGEYTGAAVAGFPLTVDATNDTFELKLNGVQSGTISLSQRNYASGAELAAELQSRINADSAIKAGGMSAVVTFDTDHFVITSAKYGSASRVEFTAVEGAGLGLSVGAGVTGEDVAGTIGGVAATGVGQVLRGTGDAAGLEVEVAGSTLGARGDVTYTRGIADQLNSFLELYLGSDSMIDMRTKGIDSSLDNITSQREQMELRLSSMEARYIAQFTSLDLIVSQMQATSSYLTQQLEALPGFYTPKK